MWRLRVRSRITKLQLKFVSRILVCAAGLISVWLVLCLCGCPWTGIRWFREEWTPSRGCPNCLLYKPLSLPELQNNLLLILVHCRATDRDRRDLVRKTWLHALQGPYTDTPRAPVRYRFVVGGRNIPYGIFADEQKVHNDLLILPDVSDSSTTLTQRTLSSLKLAQDNFNYSYLLKCDDDSVGDILRMATELHFRLRKDRLYWGQMTGCNYPIHNGPWAERHGAWTVCDHFLPYAYGGGYVLSSDLISLILSNMQILKRYSNEDTAIGAWLAPYNIERVHDIRFNTEGYSRGCKDPFIFMHKVSYGGMLKLHRSMNTTGRLCSQTTYREGDPGYVYDWTGPPSLCCMKGHKYIDIP